MTENIKISYYSVATYLGNLSSGAASVRQGAHNERKRVKREGAHAFNFNPFSLIMRFWYGQQQRPGYSAATESRIMCGLNILGYSVAVRATVCPGIFCRRDRISEDILSPRQNILATL